MQGARKVHGSRCFRVQSSAGFDAEFPLTSRITLQSSVVIRSLGIPWYTLWTSTNLSMSLLASSVQSTTGGASLFSCYHADTLGIPCVDAPIASMRLCMVFGEVGQSLTHPPAPLPSSWIWLSCASVVWALAQTLMCITHCSRLSLGGGRMDLRNL